MSPGRHLAGCLGLRFALVVAAVWPAVAGAQTAATHVCTLPVVAGAVAAVAFRAPAATCDAPTARFEVSYSGFPPDAEAAFQAAVDTWSCLVSSPVPIRVEARWEALAPATLGSAGPYLVRDVAGVPLRSTWYPGALADALAGRDTDARVPDIDAAFNRQFADWHLDPATPPAPGDFDLYTVVLHELAHGLGVIGGLAVDGGVGVVGRGASRGSYVYDRFVEDRDGSRLLDPRIYPDGSVVLADALTSAVWFAGAAAGATGGRIRLHTPRPWVDGASYSHFDEEVYTGGSPDGLMTPFIRRGESVQAPGTQTCAMLSDLGWRLAGACAAVVGPVEPAEAGVAIEAVGPNPFRGSAMARISVAAPQRVQVALVDGLGRIVARLWDGDVTPAAPAAVHLDSGRLVPGAYVLLARGEAGEARRVVSVAR